MDPREASWRAHQAATHARENYYTMRLAGYQLTEHAYARILERDIDPDHIAATLAAPTQTRVHTDGTEHRISEWATAVIERDKKILITVMEGRP